MDKRLLFWGFCFVFGFFCTWGFKQPTTKNNPANKLPAYSFNITFTPTLEKIGDLSGAVLGELKAQKFESLNQIEASNIVVNNLQTVNQPTPTLTPTSTPTPTPQSPASPAGRPSEAGATSTIKPTSTSASNPTATTTPTPTPTPLAYEKTVKDLRLALVENDYQVFYSLLSNEVTGSFTLEEIEKAFEEANLTYGRITAVALLSPIQQTGNWATQEVETKTQNGLISKFRIILHLENGDWKLFGTQELQ